MVQFTIDGGAFMRLTHNLFGEIQKKFKGYGFKEKYVSESDGVLYTKDTHPGFGVQIMNYPGVSVKVYQGVMEEPERKLFLKNNSE